ncbi:hypothetical protein LWC35_18515 [Pseudonocardia kujensis]|nr:hypothetical protein [Pseudonocardia kujensis]
MIVETAGEVMATFRASEVAATRNELAFSMTQGVRPVVEVLPVTEAPTG